MQPSLAQIGTALVAVTFIAVLAVIFDDGGAETAGPDRTNAERARSEAQAAPVIRTEEGRPTSGVEVLRFQRGDVVRFAVASDRRDTVHVRGRYDIKERVSPEDPARLEFRALRTGRFAVELDSIKNQIASVSVSR